MSDEGQPAERPFRARARRIDVMTAVQRRHAMPYGSEILPDKRVRFRLWAPGAQQVAVCLGSGDVEAVLPMAAEDDGWFGIITEMAAAETRYRYQIDGTLRVPDPASRFQPDDVHGPSEVIDPCTWQWQDGGWRGRPWHEAVIYELHVGTFTAQGTFAAVQEKLDHLVALGVTAIELMPIADFPGTRNWGYDGVLPFAPDSRYGRPDELKALIEAAHARGLMVLLDVVYNHFGPDGNYLHAYAPQFFTDRHKTPWGAAINYDDDGSRWVRQFVMHNALYWLEEYHFDGLRLDAVHAILDDSDPDILTELAARVQATFGGQRHIHLILENEHNQARYLTRLGDGKPRNYTAQWNDDIHHALHVLLTGDVNAYYTDYADDPIAHLGRCLTEGFAYQGQGSRYRGGEPRGEPSADLPHGTFVNFLQNHDQIGNRAFGERIGMLTGAAPLHAAGAVLLLAPSPPMLFMGEEWNSRSPFLFFCDFESDLAEKVVQGRREEFARFPEFQDPAARERIPNPGDVQTFQRSILDWQTLAAPDQQRWLAIYRELLEVRHTHLVPRLANAIAEKSFTQLAARALSARWRFSDGAELIVLANMSDAALADVERPSAAPLYVTRAGALEQSSNELPAWCVAWFLTGI